MPRKQRRYAVDSAFSRGLVSEAAMGQLDQFGQQEGLAQARNVYTQRDGGVRTRSSLLRSSTTIPRPTHSAIRAKPPFGTVQDQAAFTWRDGALAWFVPEDNERIDKAGRHVFARNVTLVKASATEPLFRITIQAGTRPRSVTIYDVRMLAGDWKTAVPRPGAAVGVTDDKLTYEVWAKTRPGTEAAVEFKLHNTDSDPFQPGVFAPGIIARDITIPLDHRTAEVPDLEWVEIRVPHAQTSVGTSFQLEAISAWTSDVGMGGYAMPLATAEDGDLRRAVRIVPWTFRGAGVVLVIAPDFMGYYATEGPDKPMVERFRSPLAWHFTPRQLREMTWCAFNASLLLIHRDFPHPLEVSFQTETEPFRVRPLALENVPDLPANLVSDARVQIDLTRGGVVITSPTGLAGIPTGLTVSEADLSLIAEWDRSNADSYDVVWDTAASYDADPTAWRLARAASVSSPDLPGPKATGVTETREAILGLTANVEYVVAVRAKLGSTFSALTQVERGAPLAGVLGAVTGLTAADGELDGQIVLTWDSLPGAAIYQIRYREGPAPNPEGAEQGWLPVLDLASPFAFNGDPGQVYQFQIRAVDRASRPGSWSPFVPISKQARNLRPATPSMLAAMASASADGEIEYRFVVPSGTNMFEVQYRLKDTDPDMAGDQPGAWIDYEPPADPEGSGESSEDES